MHERYARWVPRLLGCAGAALVAVDRDRTPQAAIARIVAATGETLAVGDVAREADHRVTSALGDLGAQALLAVPVLDPGDADEDHTAHTVLMAWGAARTWTPTEIADLEDLAALALSDAVPRAIRPTPAAEAEARRGRALLSLSESLSATRTLGDIAHAVDLVALIQLGCSATQLWRSDATGLHPVEPRRPGTTPSADAAPVAALRQVGQVARTGVPLLLEGDDLRLLLPLALGEQTLGVLALLWSGAEPPSTDDRTTLDALAYTAQAVQRALLLQERLDALVTLQQSLLPRLRPLPGMEVAARYLPADSRDRVGGDWYDAIALTDGGCAVTVGDVVGHDVHAAAAMGQARSVLRALSWSGSDGPAATLGRLDRALDDLGLDTLATALLVHLRPTDAYAGARGWRVSWSSAGHPPPVLLDDGTARLLTPVELDLMLGVVPTCTRTEQEATAGAGAVLLLFSDGLVERSGEHLDDGLERLRAAVQEAGRGASSLEAVLDGVLAATLDEHRADDVAVLAVRMGS